MLAQILVASSSYSRRVLYSIHYFLFLHCYIFSLSSLLISGRSVGRQIRQTNSQLVGRRQLGDHHHQTRQQVENEHVQVVVGVVGGDQKEPDGHAQQKLFCGRVLVAVVNLLPHGQVVKGAGVELKGDAGHVVEHDIRANHVGDVGERPGELAGHAGDEVEADFENANDEEMHAPRSLVVDPGGVEVGQCVLVALFGDGFGLQVPQYTGRSSSRVWIGV